MDEDRAIVPVAMIAEIKRPDRTIQFPNRRCFSLKKFHISLSLSSPSDTPQHVSEFEMRALAFADLIELPLYSTIRCILQEK
jgi:hypothetical protein